jgi:hypothetical protein
MFDSFFEKDAGGFLKALTLEWPCPKCDGKNFRILSVNERNVGEYHGRCRYCKTKCRVHFDPPSSVVEGEAEFMERIGDEDFTEEERTDMIRDFAEIASLAADNTPPGVLREKRKALDARIAFAKRRRR